LTHGKEIRVAENDDRKPEDATSKWHIDTVLTQAGRDPDAFHGFVNPPLVRASTVLFKSVADMEGRTGNRYPYGLTNTPTIESLTGALTELEGAAGTVLLPSGLAAVTLAVLAAVDAGQRLLVPDNVYYPTRRLSGRTLKRLGIEIVYYDPMDIESLAGLVDAGRTHLFLEAPGSLTFEMPDIPALIAPVQASGGLTIIDNTWATPVVYRPIEHGIDLSVQAGTKYLAGHSDLLIGSVSAAPGIWQRLYNTHRDMCLHAGPEDIWLTLRGMRTLSVRLAHHERSGLEISRWLQARPEVSQLLHPAFADCPGHDNWQRDFGRSNGLFAFVLNGANPQAEAFLEALEIFRIGASWGGFESLAILAELANSRSVRTWADGPVIRLHVGLEDVGDLKADLERGFAAMAAAV
jgi:cystathionine beta-lyase